MCGWVKFRRHVIPWKPREIHMLAHRRSIIARRSTILVVLEVSRRKLGQKISIRVLRFFVSVSPSRFNQPRSLDERLTQSMSSRKSDGHLRTKVDITLLTYGMSDHILSSGSRRCRWVRRRSLRGRREPPGHNGDLVNHLGGQSTATIRDVHRYRY